jgi:hypothetical protein
MSTNFNTKSIINPETGLCRERMGFCTTVLMSDELSKCPLCKHDVRFLHQYEQYDTNAVCCGDCFPSAPRKTKN